MGLFDFISNSKTPSIDLTDYKFLSDDHDRIESGSIKKANNKGAWRGIRIRTSDNKTFYVSMYNMNGNHPVWGDNIQMAEKCMKLIQETEERLSFRGFGKDSMGASFSDYGISLHKSGKMVNEVTLHLHDRNVDIVYKKAESRKQTAILEQFSNFDDFRDFVHKWNSTMSMDEKVAIAFKTDKIFNLGAEFYKAGELDAAVECFEKALAIMPNNDDALKILISCYTRTGATDKTNDMKKRLNYLRC
jgi:tetratricopeptide (TPR) repeat protein